MADITADASKMTADSQKERNMKKRLIVFVLSVSFILACVAACGNDSKVSEKSQAETAQVEENETSAAVQEDEEETTEAEEAIADIDYLVLVNKLHSLPAGWEDVLETTHMTNSVGDDVEVEAKAYEAYLLLKEDLEKEGVHVDLDSARRSVEDQQRIMDEFTKEYGADYAFKTVAKPGFSEHQTGLALDLYLVVDGKDVTENEEMIQYPETWKKIHDKLADYGFILRYLQEKEYITGYSYEPWHIRYLDDKGVAEQIMASGQTLEEYLGVVKVSEPSIDYGESEIYSREELEDALSLIECDFAGWDGCELHSLRYAGDKNSRDGLEWVNALGDETEYVQAAEFLGDFHSPKDGNIWDSDKEYRDYQWWLGKTKDGDWVLVTYNEDADSTSSGDKEDNEETTASQMKDGFTVAPMDGYMYCQAEDGVNVRTGWTKEDSILGVLEYGAQVHITGTVQKDGEDYGWYQIEVNGQNAYVTSSYFSVKQPAGERSEEPVNETVEEAEDEN